MTDKKVTIMELKVNLQCPCCYKKIKKILCQIPQIKDQKYDEKQNTVTITVVCCDPEKIRCKLCCKGGKIIKSIEIKPPPKPKPKPDPKPEPKPDPKPEPKPDPKPDPPVQLPAPAKVPCRPPACCVPCSEGLIGGPCYQDHGRRTCCGPCSQGVPGGPCYEDHGRPTCCGPCSQGLPGGPCYDGVRVPVPWYDNYGYGPYGVCGGRGGSVYYTGRCDYFCEENPSACRIM